MYHWAVTRLMNSSLSIYAKTRSFQCRHCISLFGVYCNKQSSQKSLGSQFLAFSLRLIMIRYQNVFQWIGIKILFEVLITHSGWYICIRFLRALAKRWSFHFYMLICFTKHSDLDSRPWKNKNPTSCVSQNFDFVPKLDERSQAKSLRFSWRKELLFPG
jgi:hypothetical protein